MIQQQAAASGAASSTSLDLSRTPFPPPYPSPIISMVLTPQILKVCLTYCSLGDHGCLTVCREIVSHSPNLHTLDLGFNGLTNSGILLCLPVLSSTLLSSLSLSGNLLTPSSPPEPSPFSIIPPNLRHICLAGNTLSPQTLSTLLSHPSIISVNIDRTKMGRYPSFRKGIQKLSLRGNPARVDFEKLPESLVELNLSFNKLTCSSIPSLLTHSPPHLLHLSLDNNFLGLHGLRLLSSSNLLTTLLTLNLSFNNFPLPSFPLLFKHLTTSTSLTTLALTGNQMDMTAAKGLAYALSHNCTLTQLSIENCSLAFNPQRHIVAGMCSNRSSGIRVLTGLSLGGVVAALNFPEQIVGWGNAEVLRFIKYCWSISRSSHPPSSALHPGYLRHAEYLRKNYPHLRAPASPQEVCHAVKVGWEAFNNRGEGESTDKAESSEDTMTTSGEIEIEESNTESMRRRSLDEPNKDTTLAMKAVSLINSRSANDFTKTFEFSGENLQWIKEAKIEYSEMDHSRLIRLFNSYPGQNRGSKRSSDGAPKKGMTSHMSMTSLRECERTRLSYYERASKRIEEAGEVEGYAILKKLEMIEGRINAKVLYAGGKDGTKRIKTIEDIILGEGAK
ncbi:hypothetical protein TrVE_jg4041 [Triparma verrucosa]|uniref:RNI-like protein n=1 Tax=Triparma verrucosa TaxID=1606542 RepID=A0A9W7BVT6_9STRA|nr:hypothetical protein TrVE_jg4041 [Triparma verrucosa]